MVKKIFYTSSLFMLMLALAACSGSSSSDGDTTADVASSDSADGTAEVCIEGEACDDGDPCTEDDTCTGGVCDGTARVCDDDLFCNGPETCNPDTGECAPGTPPSLADGVVCTVDACDEETDEVTHTPDDAGCDDGDVCSENYCDPQDGCQATFNTEPCDDDDLCTDNDACFEGKCLGNAVVCDDGAWCNGEEVCDAETGECLTQNVPELDDGVDCTLDECDEDDDEVTHTADDLFCDDANQCTLDVCDPVDGCSSTNTEELCDDGELCTVDDTCAEGECVGVAVECDDGLYCNGVESCDDETGECQDGVPPVSEDEYDCTVEVCDEEKDKIVHMPEDTLCDDLSVCTTDICFPAAGGCMYEDVDCSDGLFCTGEEGCDPVDGCTEGVPPVLDDTFDCTADSCDEENDVVVHDPDDAKCDDTLWCNGAETCSVEHGCQNGQVPEDDDGVVCTVEACDEENDVITHTADDTLCDNTLWCDGAETCDSTLDCQPGVGPDLSDDVGCTIDTCDEENDQVVHEVDDTACDDALWCNGAETCDLILDCQDGTAPVLEDDHECTVDSCDEENDVVVHEPDDTLCDDQNVCSDDACLVDAGCLNTANTSECDDDDPCTLDDVCAGLECAGTPKNCSDGLFCNGEEVCQEGTGDCVPGPELDYSDEIDCTVDDCDEDQDVLTHVANHEACDDQNACTDEECVVGVGCEYADLDIACADGEECTDGDWCVEGMCEPGTWACEDCTNEVDDNADDKVDCCDDLCLDDAVCQAETVCNDQKDNDCDNLFDCDDDDCSEAPECQPVPGVGDLVITEILQNPSGTDTGKEWFEVFNVSQETFDLKGLTVSDMAQDQFTVETSLVVAPGESVVFGPNGNAATNGGVAIDYIYSGFTLANGDDEIRLTWGETTVDEVAYDGGPNFPNPDGTSMQLAPESISAAANDDGSAWCEGKVPFGDGDFGTPGEMNTPCKEIFCDDNQDDDYNGLTDCYDPTCQGIAGCGEIQCGDELDNDNDNKPDCEDDDCSGADECVDTDQDGVPDIKDICPIGNDNVDLDQDGLPDDCEIGWAGDVWPLQSEPVSSSQDVTIYLQIYKLGVTNLVGPGEGVIATLKYKTAMFPDYLTKSMEFNKDVGDNDEYKATVSSFDLVNTSELTVEFELEYVHPSFDGLGVQYIYNGPIKDQAQNEAPLIYTVQAAGEPPSPGDIIINEIMRDPEAVAETAGEWFELLNKTFKNIELAGLVISDDGGQNFTVNSSVVVGPFQTAVFTINGDSQANGGVTEDYVYPSSFRLANGEDEIIIMSGGILIDQVKYGTGFPTTPGASMKLDKNFSSAAENDVGANWCASTTPMTGGDKGTPGIPNGTCP